jgi:1-acyl-sn-glycerol-3-phosphate acyltransferase
MEKYGSGGTDMPFIRTAFLMTVVAAVMLLLVAPGLVFLLLRLMGFRNLVASVTYRLAQGWARMMLFFSGSSVEVSGRENIPPEGGICFVGNHCSVVDILLVLGYAGRPTGFIAKQELLAIPLLNVWILLLGGLFLDRQKVRRAVKTIQSGVEKIKNGYAMIIFPEGHRSRGQGLLPFHSGSFKLATQSGCPIVPVAITGTWEMYEKTGFLRRVPVSITFLPPLRPGDIEGSDRRQAAAEKVREKIALALAERGIQKSEDMEPENGR